MKRAWSSGTCLAERARMSSAGKLWYFFQRPPGEKKLQAQQEISLFMVTVGLFNKQPVALCTCQRQTQLTSEQVRAQQGQVMAPYLAV